jgi:hypothetical protein
VGRASCSSMSPTQFQPSSGPSSSNNCSGSCPGYTKHHHTPVCRWCTLITVVHHLHHPVTLSSPQPIINLNMTQLRCSNRIICCAAVGAAQDPVPAE